MNIGLKSKNKVLCLVLFVFLVFSLCSPVYATAILNYTVYGASVVAGKYGGGFSFDGVNDYASIPHDASLNFGIEDWTIAFWMKKDLYDCSDEGLINKIGILGDSDGYGVFLRDNNNLWVQHNRDSAIDLTYPILLWPGMTDEASNPTMTADNTTWEDNGICEPSDFMLPNGTYIRWYRAGDGPDYDIGVVTSTDGITWSRYSGNPLIFDGIASGDAQFPYVVQDGECYYMFVLDLGDFKHYLYNVTSLTSPVLMNGGNPVLEISQPWELDITNVGVCIVGSVWHMLYEGTVEAGTGNYSLGYAYSTLGEMNWTAHKSVLNPIIFHSCNPYLVYVPERNAILAITAHGSGVTFEETILYASLSNNLNNPSSWNLGKILVSRSIFVPVYNGTYNIHTDASLLVGFNVTYNIMLAWSPDQATIYQAYCNLSLTEFFDALSETDAWMNICVVNDAGVLSLYLDGTLAETETWANNVTISQNLVFGRNSYTASQFYAGLLDGIYIYNRALNSSEILSLKNNVVPSSGLVGSWCFAVSASPVTFNFPTYNSNFSFPVGSQYSTLSFDESDLNLTGFKIPSVTITRNFGIRTNKNIQLVTLTNNLLQFYVSGSGTASISLFGFSDLGSPSSIDRATLVSYVAGTITLSASLSSPLVILTWGTLSENAFSLVMFIFGFALMLVSIGMIFLTRPDMEKTALLVMTAIIGFGIWWGVGL